MSTFHELSIKENIHVAQITDFSETLVGSIQLKKNIETVREKIKDHKVLFYTWDHTAFLIYPTYKFAGFENILGNHYKGKDWCVSTSCKNNYFDNHFQNFDNFLQFIQLGGSSSFQELDHSKKSKDFLFLNGKPHPHRVELVREMLKHGLLENSVWSFNDDNVAHKKIDAMYEWPNYQNKVFDGYSDHSRMVHPVQYNDTVCSMITETLEDDSIPFISEKTAKSMMAGHLFVILSGRHFLRGLHSLGFKTFSFAFDESYDDAETRSARIYRIINTLRYIKECDYVKLYKDTREIREHNQKLIMDKKKFSDLNLQEFTRAGEYLARY